MTKQRFEYLDVRSDSIDHAALVGYAVSNGEAVYLEDRDREVHTYVCGISGSGKTRFLENLLLHDIRKGHPVCLIDPTGYLYGKCKEYVAYCVERAMEAGHSRFELGERYLFLDVTDSENPLRLNPLEPQGAETTEQQVDDLLKAIERLFPKTLEDQRRLRNILRNALWVLAELNRLPEEARPHLPQGWAYPLNLRYCGKFIFILKDEERLRLVEAIPESIANEWAKEFWRDFAEATKSEQREYRNSSVNVLQYLVGDSLVSRFFETGISSLNIPELLGQGKSLFCHFPLGENLSGTTLLGKYLATKFQRSAYRRSAEERKRAYYLYMDEFHEFADQEFAGSVTNLRQFGLRLVNSHQSQSQPPFHTAEGKALLQTIRANSQVKVLFRLDRPDAEEMSKELFELSQRKPNFAYLERSGTWSEERSRNIAFSFQITEGTASTWSRSESRTLAQTTTMGLGRTSGTNIGRTLTEGFGGSRAASLARGISRSESQGITEAYSTQHGLSVAIGENWSQLRDTRRGLQLTIGENESFAVQRGGSRSQTQSDQWGHSDTEGRSTQTSLSSGASFEHGRNGSIALYGLRGSKSTGGESSSSGSTTNAARSQGSEYSRAISRIEGISRGLEENWGKTSTQGTKRDRGTNQSEGESLGSGGSRQETTSDSTSTTKGRSREIGRSESETSSETQSESWEQSLSETMSILEQVSRTYSKALQEGLSHSEAIGGSEHRDTSRGQTIGSAESSGESFAISEKLVYYTLDGERELLVNRLQALSRRQCFVSTGALSATLVESLFVDEEHYSRVGEDLPRLLLEEQRSRIIGKGTGEISADERAAGEKAAKGTTGGENPEAEDWPFED